MSDSALVIVNNLETETAPLFGTVSSLLLVSALLQCSSEKSPHRNSARTPVALPRPLAPVSWYMKNLLHMEKWMLVFDMNWFTAQHYLIIIIKKGILHTLQILQICLLFKFVWCLCHNIAMQTDTQRIARLFSMVGYFQQFHQGLLAKVQCPWCYF